MSKLGDVCCLNLSFFYCKMIGIAALEKVIHILTLVCNPIAKLDGGLIRVHDLSVRTNYERVVKN